MKKILALLLVLLVMIPMFTMGSFAFHEFYVEENYCNAGFVYIIDGKAFFSSKKAMSELKQTGRTTIYLPSECEGKNVYIKGVSRFWNYWGYEFKVSETCFLMAREGGDPDIEVTYYIDFVCSENVEYDYERQIGTSDYIKFAGYSTRDTRIVFFSQNELDTALNNGEVFIEDTYLKENPFNTSISGSDKFNIIHEYDDIAGASATTDGSCFVFEVELNDRTKHYIYVNLMERIERCSCNCHKSGFLGFIWKITLFFSKLFNTNRECICKVIHY